MEKDDKPTKHEFPILSSFASFRLAQTQNQITSQGIATLAKYSNLTLTEWRVILLVQSEGETTATDIVRIGQIDKGQVSRAIKSLKAKELLLFDNTGPDQRQTMLKLAPPGEQTYEKLVSIMRRRQQVLTQDLSEEELQLFYSILDRMQRRAKEVL